MSSHQPVAAEPLVEVKRGPITESRHRGHIAVMDASGRTIASAGEPNTVTYLRSSAKPFQALPVIVSGAADHFGFSDEEVALACASHNGEQMHVRIVASMLRKIGLPAEALKCGTHEPYSKQASSELREKGEQPSVLHNNCSGKHAAMLAFAKHLGAPTETYHLLENPVQIEIRKIVATFSGVPVMDLAVGIDGCSVPVFGMPVGAMALAYARLVSPPQIYDKKVREACARIVKVMSSYPELIGGTSERLDTELMRAAPGKFVSKVGAEGVYTAGILPSERWPGGFGIALKIEDGDDQRARPTAVIEALRQLEVLDEDAFRAVSRYASFPVRNRNGHIVGEVCPSFSLRMNPELVSE